MVLFLYSIVNPPFSLYCIYHHATFLPLATQFPNISTNHAAVIVSWTSPCNILTVAVSNLQTYQYILHFVCPLKFQNYFPLTIPVISINSPSKFLNCCLKPPLVSIELSGHCVAPVFEGYAIVSMLGAMIASIVECTGDCLAYFGSLPPTGAFISHGQATEGIGLFICGIFGTSNGTTI